jgi:NADH-quinone oxidoreductase subunit L
MPWTYSTFLIGSLSLAGIWPLAGFWSKDEVLLTAFEGNQPLFVLALITVFMTAFYMFRVIYLTFHGEYKGGDPSTKSHPHESPGVMVWPMVFLAVLAIGAGWWNVTGAFGDFMGHGETKGFIEGFLGIFGTWLPWVSLLFAGAGILLAYLMYSAKRVSPERMAARFKPLYTAFLRKYWLDELYEDVIVRKLLIGGLFRGLQKTDSGIIDAAVNGAGSLAVAGGKAARQVQTGQLQLYGLSIAIGAAIITIVVLLVG